MAIKTTAAQRKAMTNEDTTEKDFLARTEKNQDSAKKILAKFLEKIKG